LISHEGHVAIADFGLTVNQDAKNNKTTLNMGSPYFMPPEVINFGERTIYSDIWSVGCTVIEMLQAKPPNYNLAPMQAIYTIASQDRPPFPPNLSEECNDFLMSCFKKVPNERLNSKDLVSHAWIRSNLLKFGNLYVDENNKVKHVKHEQHKLALQKQNEDGEIVEKEIGEEEKKDVLEQFLQKRMDVEKLGQVLSRRVSSKKLLDKKVIMSSLNLAEEKK